MAMTKCKECGADVSKKAKKCPQCGVDNPGVTTKDYIIGGVAVVIILTALVSFFSDDQSEASGGGTGMAVTDLDQAEAQMAKEEACNTDLQCWGEENWSAATNRCAKAIERLAEYEVKWTDSYPDTKLNRRAWLDEEEGTLSYYGDRVQFSNGYGAFQNYMYRCDYDPKTKSVLNLELEPGRI